jgi:hypothetical protein
MNISCKKIKISCKKLKFDEKIKFGLKINFPGKKN